MCKHVYGCGCTHVSTGACEAEVTAGLPGGGVRVVTIKYILSCKPPAMCAVNRAQVLWKSIAHS